MVTQVPYEPTVDALGAQWATLIDLADGLDDDQWGSPSILAGWTVADVFAHWQRATGKRQRARAFDSKQTAVEQAYAAAIKERWKHVDHPHQSFRRTPYWLATGILLDAESERHLLKVTEDRIATMQQKIGSGMR